jgi:hypothetical protein
VVSLFLWLNGNFCVEFLSNAYFNDIYKTMKAASISEIKKELENKPGDECMGLCLRLAKFKKENKELLSYLLFESDDMPSYLNNVKLEIDEFFAGMNFSAVYFIKKTIRKILRQVNKQIKFTASKEAEVELLIYFCNSMIDSGIPFNKSAALSNIYNAQIKKIQDALQNLHPDLQHDLEKQLKRRH